MTGEVQIARNELVTLELKKSQAQRDADKILTEASTSAHDAIEHANARATAHVEEIYREGRADIRQEREAAQVQLEAIRTQIIKDMDLVAAWEKQASEVPASFIAHYNQVLDSVEKHGRYEQSGVSGISGTVGISGVSGYSGFSRIRAGSWITTHIDKGSGSLG